MASTVAEMTVATCAGSCGAKNNLRDLSVE